MRNYSSRIIAEKSVQTSIRNYLKKNGWFVVKLISTSRNGIPDLMALKNARTIFIEVKKNDGKEPEKHLSELQKDCISELRKQGFEVFIENNLTEFKKKYDKE